MSDLEAIGGAVTGSLAAAAIERERDPGSDGHTHEHACLNCGTRLDGPYCHACGQHSHVHRTLGAFFHDLAHGVFHVEGRTWRTLPMLAWRPGDLTRRYIEGQRARFVSPMALFLFSVFLMFAVVSNLATMPHFDNSRATTELNKAATDTAAQLSALRDQRNLAISQHRSTAAIDAKIASEAHDLDVMTSLSKNGLIRGGALQLSADVPGFIREPVQRAAANPELLIYKLKSSAYKWSWALIPLSVPFMWLLFPFSRRFRLYDHTVFVTYSLSFMSLFVVLLTILAKLGVPGTFAASVIVPPVHMYRQLKGAYGLNRASAALRTVALIVFAQVAISLFLIAMLAMGLLD